MDTETDSRPTQEAAPAAIAPTPPPVVFDDPRFVVEREVARGGMGRILAAPDRLLGRRVAIKVSLHARNAPHDRLGREAAILALLDHPSIPPVFELGRLA